MTNGITPLMNTDDRQQAEGAGSRSRPIPNSHLSAMMYRSLHGSMTHYITRRAS